jgi:hypothetical protein
VLAPAVAAGPADQQTHLVLRLSGQAEHLLLACLGRCALVLLALLSRMPQAAALLRCQHQRVCPHALHIRLAHGHHLWLPLQLDQGRLVGRQSGVGLRLCWCGGAATAGEVVLPQHGAAPSLHRRCRTPSVCSRVQCCCRPRACWLLLGESLSCLVGDAGLPNRDSSTKLSLATTRYVALSQGRRNTRTRAHTAQQQLSRQRCLCTCRQSAARLTHVPDLLDRALPRLALEPARPIVLCCGRCWVCAHATAARTARVLSVMCRGIQL